MFTIGAGKTSLFDIGPTELAVASAGRSACIDRTAVDKNRANLKKPDAENLTYDLRNRRGLKTDRGRDAVVTGAQTQRPLRGSYSVFFT
jgi:hypothetical protein